MTSFRQRVGGQVLPEKTQLKEESDMAENRQLISGLRKSLMHLSLLTLKKELLEIVEARPDGDEPRRRASQRLHNDSP